MPVGQLSSQDTWQHSHGFYVDCAKQMNTIRSGAVPRLAGRLARPGELSIRGLLRARIDELAGLAGADESFDQFRASERGKAAIDALLAQHAAAMRQCPSAGSAA